MDWYQDELVCPLDHQPLKLSDGFLISSAGRRYPVVDGIPVMLLEDADQTHWVAQRSLKRAQGDESVIDRRAPELYLESLGINDQERQGIVRLADRGDLDIDPVVSYLVGATCGNTYGHLTGNLKSYPIPDLRLPEVTGDSFLELGCNWGRWCIAAARKGYAAVGIDPSLGAVMAARRVARQLDLPIKYLVADARYLPFKESRFDTVFSYSVLQHVSKADTRAVLLAATRILKPGGTSLVQMPNFLGIRCLQNQLKRGFREGRDFEVRYWSIPELKRTFREYIGDTEISVDCFFGLGLQESDVAAMPLRFKLLINLSGALRKTSMKLRILRYFADSVFVRSTKQSPSDDLQEP